MRVPKVFLLVLLVLLVEQTCWAAGDLHYIVKYKSTTTAIQKVDLVNQINNSCTNQTNQTGSTENEVSYQESSFNTQLQFVDILDTQDVGLVINSFQSSPFVEYIEPDYTMAVSTTGDNTLPYDPTDPAAGDTGDGTVLLPVKVAVLDSGVYAHPDLSASILPGYNFVDDNTDVSDVLGHGTMIAGKVADAGYIKILPLKVIGNDGYGSYSDLIEGIYYAVQQSAKIINMSLGCQFESQALKEAIDYASAHGVLMIAAAGNNGLDMSIYPAAYKDVLAVGALNSSNERLNTSNYGEYVDLFAPGENISSTYLNGTYQTSSGTSLAAAIVTNAAAKLAYKNPTKSAIWLAQILKVSASDIGVPGWDRETGYGAVNLSRAFTSRVSTDLAVSGAEMNIEKPLPGQLTSVTFFVYNAGIYDTPQTMLNFSVNSITQSNAVIPILKPGEKIAVSFNWFPATAGTYQLAGESLYQDSNSANNKRTISAEATTTAVKKIDFQNFNAYYMDENLNIKIKFDLVNKSNVTVTCPTSVYFQGDVISENENITLPAGSTVSREYTYLLDPLNPKGVCDISSVLVKCTPDSGEIVRKLDFNLSGYIEPLFSWYTHSMIIETLITKWANAYPQNKESWLYTERDWIEAASTYEDYVGFLYHGWDPEAGPEAGWKYMSSDSAYERAVQHSGYFAYFKSINDLSGASYHAGVLLHLLIDMAVPTHAHADVNLSNEEYEKWAVQNLKNSTQISAYVSSVAVPVARVYPTVPFVDSNLANYKSTLMYRMAEVGDNYDSYNFDGDTPEGDVCYMAAEERQIIIFKVIKVKYFKYKKMWVTGANERIANGTLPSLASYFYDTLYWLQNN